MADDKTPQGDGWDHARRVLNDYVEAGTAAVNRHRSAWRISMSLLMAGSACMTVYIIHKNGSKNFGTASSILKQYILLQKPLHGKIVAVDNNGRLHFHHKTTYMRVVELIVPAKGKMPASTIECKLLGVTPTASGVQWLRDTLVDNTVNLTPVGRSYKPQNMQGEAQGVELQQHDTPDAFIVAIIRRKLRWAGRRSDVSIELLQKQLAMIDEQIVIGQETSQNPSHVRTMRGYFDQLNNQGKRSWFQFIQDRLHGS